jgi:hypothetical protein
MQTANPPKVGDKVFLPELKLWGEIVEFYDENNHLIQRVRVMVNGKPTILEVANLIVELATLVPQIVSLWAKIKAGAKSLCQKLGLCKKSPPLAVVPDALKTTIEDLYHNLWIAQKTAGVSPQQLEKQQAAILQLEKLLPNEK